MDKNHSPKERLWNGEYLKVMCGNFLLFFAFYLLTPLLPLFLDAQFHADKDIIGLVLSGYVVATLLVRPFSGFMVDCFNRKKVLVICFFVFFICFAGYIGASTLLAFAIVRTFHGIPFGASTVANSTVAIDVLPASRRNEGIGFYGLSNNLAMAVAPSVGIWLYHATDNFPLLFWISLIVALAGFITVSTIKLRPRDIVKAKPAISLDHFFLTRAWLMAANICLFGLCWGVMGNYVAIFAQEKLEMTEGIGIFFLVLSAGLMLSRFMGRKALREGRITESCLQGVALSSAGYLLFALALGPWSFYLSALLVGLGNGRMYPSFLSMFVRVARHDQRGTANSSILISWDLGMGIGILMGGFIAQYVNYSAAFWIVAIIQITGSLLYALFTRRFYLARARTDA